MLDKHTKNAILVLVLESPTLGLDFHLELANGVPTQHKVSHYA